MRLAILTNNRLPPREGIGRHVLETGRRLAARGHAVTLLAPGAPFAGWSEGQLEGLRLLRYPHVPLRPFHHVVARRELGHWLAAGADGAELLHVHLPLLPPLPTTLPLVVTVHTPLLADVAAITEPGLRPLAFRAHARLASRRWEQWYLDRAHEVVAVSTTVAGELASHYALRGRRPRVVPNGVDTDFFAAAPAAPRACLVLYVGRLGYRKGLLRLLDAFARVRSADARLALVGEGPLRARLRDRAAELGIAERVDFAGFAERAAVRDWLARAACFVNPADYEGFPLTLLEAMSAGTPVVSTPIGALVDLGPRPPVRLAAARSDALAEAIEEVLAAPHEALQRADAARLMARARFSWDRVVDALEEVYVTPRAAA